MEAGHKGAKPEAARPLNLNEHKKLANLWEFWPLIQRVPLALGEIALCYRRCTDETKARYIICEASAKFKNSEKFQDGDSRASTPVGGSF